MKKYIAIIFVLVAVLACKKLPLSKAYWESTVLDNPEVINGYDESSGLRWTVSNDETHLYFRMDVDNRATMMSLFRNGLLLKFDTMGRKKESAYLRYPVIKRPQPGDSENQRPEMGERKSKQNRQLDNFKSPKNALWHRGGQNLNINLLLNQTEFDAHIGFDTAGILYYYAVIPINEIYAGAKSDKTQLSMCIELQPFQMPGSANRENMQGFRRPEGRPGGGFPGGRPGGGAPGRGTGRPGGYMQQMPDFSSMQEVEIWFKLQMATKP
jgi:hypothetical protein